MARLEELGGNRGATFNSVAGMLGNRRFVEQEMRKLAAPDLYIVQAYDHVAGTVDLVPKTNPGHQAVMGVPIQGMGGSMRDYWGFQTIANGSTEPDVGWLVFPKTDSARAFIDFSRRLPPSSRIFRPFNGVFWPGTPIQSQTRPPNVTLTPTKATDLGPGDIGRLNPNGYGFIIKADGKLVLIAEEAYILGPGQDYGDADKVAREGDGVDLGSGNISGGSERFHSS